MAKMKDLTGRKYGRLTVIKPLEERRNGSVVWKTKCECGNELDVMSSSIIRGNTKSCGCIQKEYAKKNMSTFNSDTFREKNLKEKTNISLLKEINYKDNTSGIRGVCFDKRTNSWVATIGFKKRIIHLGRFKNINDATKARKDAEERYYKPILDKYAEEE